VGARTGTKGRKIMLGKDAFPPEYGSPEYVKLRTEKFERHFVSFWDEMFDSHPGYAPKRECFVCGKPINRNADDYTYLMFSWDVVFRVHAECVEEEQ